MQRGFDSYAEYLDNGYVGNTFDRPAFAKMEADIDAGKIDTVIVKSIDRIARDYILLDGWLKNLSARGVTLITMDGTYEQLPLPEIMAAFIQYTQRERNNKRREAVT